MSLRQPHDPPDRRCHSGTARHRRCGHRGQPLTGPEDLRLHRAEQAVRAAEARQAELRLLSITGAAQALHVTPSRVRQLVEEGQLPAPIRAGDRAAVWTAELIEAVRVRRHLQAHARPPATP